jgi:ribonuclease E
MSKRMLIDASHPEETRVVVLDGNKIEEFDFESASRRPLKGNIYLAKVTRVEPSLQAAFVEYGGNRQGFLAFSEIHPDYYQIPVADRLALLADQSRRLIEEDEEVDAVATNIAPSKPGMLATDVAAEDTDETPENESASEPDSEPGAAADEDSEAEGAPEAEDETEDETELELSDTQELESSESGSDSASTPEAIDDSDSEAQDNNEDSDRAEGEEELAQAPIDEAESNSGDGGESESTKVAAESTGTAPTLERKSRSKRPPRRRHYKIQEVIRRKQIILVQVVKEERGNKGASLTTYLSLAGRYCVLMPNTPRGGGISRKITSVTDRKRLKSAAQALELPEGMGLIIRTAGANRTKAEIKRDYEYLLRLWDSVRELTLKSNAPALVYEEGNLVKRTIRDLYGKEVSEVTVDGEPGYRDAKDFMRMLMPSHAKNVKLYKGDVSLFQRHQVEAQLDAMFSPIVTLRSGGYIVINQTEALVAVDVNSGKATREHSIEETARKTNLEAAEEVGRQLRLRDLAGLIVIDFIDMEDGKNDRSVEKRLRDSVRNDRARIQIGKISQFGLLEMSRQRLRSGVLAGSTEACPHCEGLGYIRSTESASLQLLRALDDEGQQQTAESLIARAPEKIIIYTVNHKRPEISRIEQIYEMPIAFETKDDMSGGTFDIERVGKRSASKQRKPAVVSIEAGFQEQEAEEAEPEEIVEVEAEAGPVNAETSSEDEQSDENNVQNPRRRRRRGGRGRGRGQKNAEATPEPSEEAAAPTAGEQTPNPEQAESDNGGERKKRRRRRGRRGRKPEPESNANASGQTGEGPQTAGDGETISSPTDAAAPEASNTKSRPRRSTKNNGANEGANDGPTQASEPKDASIARPVTGERNVDTHKDTPMSAVSADNKDSESPTRKGWWQRKLGI